MSRNKQQCTMDVKQFIYIVYELLVTIIVIWHKHIKLSTFRRWEGEGEGESRREGPDGAGHSTEGESRRERVGGRRSEGETEGEGHGDWGGEGKVHKHIIIYYVRSEVSEEFKISNHKYPKPLVLVLFPKNGWNICFVDHDFVSRAPPHLSIPNKNTVLL